MVLREFWQGGSLSFNVPVLYVWTRAAGEALDGSKQFSACPVVNFKGRKLCGNDMDETGGFSYFKPRRLFPSRYAARKAVCAALTV